MNNNSSSNRRSQEIHSYFPSSWFAIGLVVSFSFAVILSLRLLSPTNFNHVYRTLSAFIISRIIKYYVTIIFILLSCAWINSELLLLGITRAPTVQSSFNFTKDVMRFILSFSFALFLWNHFENRDLLTIWWILNERLLHFFFSFSNHSCI